MARPLLDSDNSSISIVVLKDLINSYLCVYATEKSRKKVAL